jgi:hypothetical protein
MRGRFMLCLELSVRLSKLYALPLFAGHRLLAFLACFGNVGENKPVLWSDPGKVETIDFTHALQGPAGAPLAPFQFVREDKTGTSPKIVVRDARGIEWRIKGGLEVRAETFVTRLVGALGYYTETTYFLPDGRIEGIGAIDRARGFVKPDGTFTYASFERRDAEVFFSRERWAWNDSPFENTPELNGLKILVMLVSNWDNKDARDALRGSNTSVLTCGAGAEQRRVFFVNDWGQTMGRWGYGGIIGRQSSWNCADFASQTPAFVTGSNGRTVRFGYRGQHTEEFKSGIGVKDVRWLMQYLGRVTDAQLHAGLAASGATREEEDCFSRALRSRIEQLRKIAGSPPAAAGIH